MPFALIQGSDNEILRGSYKVPSSPLAHTSGRFLITELNHVQPLQAAPPPRIILCMRPANERRRYIVTSPLICWAHTQNDPHSATSTRAKQTVTFIISPHIWRECMQLVLITSGVPLANRYQQPDISRTWTSKYAHYFLWDVITHPCHHFKGTVKPLA